MRIPFELQCSQCRKGNTVWIGHTESSIEHRCECGNDLSAILDLNFTPGFMGLLRSEYELRVSEDYDLSIVLSATAFEWQLVFMHNKWAEIDAYTDSRGISPSELEAMWKSHRNIFDRIRAAGKLLYPAGFEEYVRKTKEFREIVASGFPSLSLDELSVTMHKHLFVPRNRIIHFGQSDYSKEQAVRSYNIGRLGVVVLHSMDMARRGEI